MGKKDEADRFVADWMKAHPKDLGTRSRLGEMALRQGDFDKASRLLSEAHAIDASNVRTLSLLVQTEAARGNKDFVPAAVKAASWNPTDPMVHAALARLLLLNGRTQEAIPPMRRAVALSGGHPEMRLELAKILLAADMRKDAKVELDALAARGPAMPRASEVAALRRQL